MQRTGYIQTSTFISNQTCTYTVKDAVMQSCMQTVDVFNHALNGGRDKTRARQRATTVYLLCTVTYRQFYLTDLAPHLSYKETRKTPIKDKGVDWTSGVFMFMEL